MMWSTILSIWLHIGREQDVVGNWDGLGHKTSVKHRDGLFVVLQWKHGKKHVFLLGHRHVIDHHWIGCLGKLGSHRCCKSCTSPTFQSSELLLFQAEMMPGWPLAEAKPTNPSNVISRKPEASHQSLCLLNRRIFYPYCHKQHHRQPLAVVNGFITSSGSLKNPSHILNIHCVDGTYKTWTEQEHTNTVHFSSFLQLFSKKLTPLGMMKKFQVCALSRLCGRGESAPAGTDGATSFV